MHTASGGYYLAMGCDAIVAEELTLTGSIGVVLAKFNLQGLLRKIGKCCCAVVLLCCCVVVLV